MMESVRKISGVVFDLRVIVGASGMLLSVLMHELFHVIMHWTEIESIRLFPNSQAIVEVVFAPSTRYDLIAEEALAYLVTMVTLLLTALLINDVHDARHQVSTSQTVLAKDFADCYVPADEKRAYDQLSTFLGIPRVR